MPTVVQAGRWLQPWAGGLCAIAVLGACGGSSLGARDPFWPLGYTPPAVAVPPPPPSGTSEVRPAVVPTGVDEASWQAAEREIGIRPARYSIGEGSDREAFVMLAGTVRSKGDVVTVRRDGIRFSWRVDKVGRDQVVFTRVSADSAPAPKADGAATR